MIFGDGVTSIGDYAFPNIATLTNVVFPESLTRIGKNAFSRTSLTNINFPAGLLSIGQYAFMECAALTSITIPDKITIIDTYTFEDCTSLAEVKIGLGVATIAEYAFGGCKALTSIDIPDNVSVMESYAFRDCSNLKDVTIGRGITTLGLNVFSASNSIYYMKATTPPAIQVARDANNNVYSCFGYDTSAKTIYVPSEAYDAYTQSTSYKINTTTSANWAIYKKYIVRVEPELDQSGLLNNEILYTTTDGEIAKLYKQDAFDVEVVSNTYENGVGKIVCNADITEIIYYAFRGCENLQTITLPASVAKIGQYAIYSCPNLTAIYCKATTPPAIYYQYAQIGSFPFQPGMKIYVPREAIDAYTQYSPDRWAEMSYDPFNWSQYQSYLEPYDF